MSILKHLKRVLGWPRFRAITMKDVPAAEPDMATEEVVRKATAQFVLNKWEADKASKEVRHLIASGALQLLIGRKNGTGHV